VATQCMDVLKGYYRFMNSVLKKVYIPMWSRLCARQRTIGNIALDIWQSALDKINHPVSEIMLDVFIESIKEEIKEETNYHIPLKTK